MVKVALPLLTVTVPMEVPPSENVTVPVGMPAPGVVTAMVAVKVTLWPKTEGLAELANVVVVAALLTTCISVLLGGLARKLASPAYATVMLCVPTVRTDLPSVAVPEVRVAVPMETPPSIKVTVPVGVPAPGGCAVTVAIKLMAWPNTEGLAELANVVVVAALFTTWTMALLEGLWRKLLSPP